MPLSKRMLHRLLKATSTIPSFYEGLFALPLQKLIIRRIVLLLTYSVVTTVLLVRTQSEHAPPCCVRLVYLVLSIITAFTVVQSSTGQWQCDAFKPHFFPTSMFLAKWRFALCDQRAESPLLWFRLGASDRHGVLLLVSDISIFYFLIFNF